MTNTQQYALIVLILAAGLLVGLGYFYGRRDGVLLGMIKGSKAARTASQTTILNLQEAQEQRDKDYQKLERQYTRALHSRFSSNERAILLKAADNLSLSSATFGALNAKAQAEQALRLRDEVIAVARLIEPQVQERAA
jgi:hypothetical protein